MRLPLRIGDDAPGVVLLQVNAMCRPRFPAAHHAGMSEIYDPEDRDRMAVVIPCLKAPAIHYKIFAAGRNDPAEAFAYVQSYLRAQDAVCVGIYPKDKPHVLEENVRLFRRSQEFMER